MIAGPLDTRQTPNGHGMAGVNDQAVANNHVVTGPLGGGNDGIGRRSEDDPNLVAYALRRDPGGTGQGHNTNYVPTAQTVRRLTPTECERLQALPDGWTLIDPKTPDSRRYAGLGDAVTASVAEWIGQRIMTAHLAAEAAA